MKIFSHALALLFLTLLIASCSNKNQSQEKSTSVGINQVLDMETYQSRLESGEIMQFIDVRTPEEYALGTIGEARNIDYEAEDFKDRIAQLDRNKPVYIFCQSGNRSGEAAKVMEEMGFQEIYDLKGGYGNWTAGNK